MKKILLCLIIFVLTSTCYAQEDTSLAVPNYIASVVEVERTIDSLQSSTVHLVPFQNEIFRVARKHGLPPALLAAFVQQESRFDQWATRTEPHYKKKKVVINEAKAWTKKSGGIPTVNTEIDDRSRSYGLGQVMGQKAREQGFDSKYLAALYDPEKNINAIALEVKRVFRVYPGDTLSAISAYNQGNNRKENGIFKNMPYVYNVTQYWKHYQKIFARIEYNEQKKNFNRVRDSILTRLYPWNVAWMFRMQPGRTDSLGIETLRVTISDTEARFYESQGRDTTSAVFRQGNGKQSGEILIREFKTGHVRNPNENAIILSAGLIALFGFGWLLRHHSRQRADLAGYDQRVPKHIDKAVQRNLRKELKKTRKDRALHSLGLIGDNERLDKPNVAR